MLVLPFQLCLQQSAVSPANTVLMLPLPQDKCLAAKHKLTGAEDFFFSCTARSNLQAGALITVPNQELQGSSKHSL